MNNNYYTKSLSLFVLSVILIVVMTSFGEDIKKDQVAANSDKGAFEKEQTLCPLTQKMIDKEAYGDYNGKRVYLCCNGCLARFKNNPERAMKKLKELHVVVAVTDEVTMQNNCPVNNDAIDKLLFEDHDFKRIYFCSEKCKKKFKKNPQKYIKD